MYRMLIVDDEPKIVEGLKLMLDWEEMGIHQIVTATSYEEGLQKAMEFQPHIALLDIRLRDRRGYDMIGALRSFSLPTRYVMISGYDEFEYARQAIRAGAKDYLMKPIDREELRRVVEKIIVEDFHGTLNTKVAEENLDPVLREPYASFSNLTAKVLLMVKEEYGQNINLKVIADKFRMNSNYLGQIFIRETHIKFSEYLMVYRLNQAKRLLEDTQDKIYNIARAVGYSNVNYFYTHFHLYYDVSPSDFRNQDDQ